MKRIAIIGLGQIGGSIVLTLRKNKKKYSITGIDTSSKRLQLLSSMLDHSSKRWEDAADADLTVACLHYDRTMDFLQQSEPDRLLMDVCSGKANLLRVANRRKLRFVGCHPIAGNEFAVEKGWREDLFRNSPFFVCPAKYSTDRDLKAVRNFIHELGGRPMIVNALQHDRFVSITSHLPAVLAGLLAESAQSVPSAFKGPGFHSMTRLAKTSPELMKTFLDSNLPNMLRTAKNLNQLLERWIQERLKVKKVKG